MLSVQSSINSVPFGERARRPFSPDERQRIMEQRELQMERAEILRQRAELEALAHDDSAPSVMKKVAKTGALLTAGVAVGLTAGGGTKILINRAKDFKNSNFMKTVKEYAKSFKKACSESAEAIKKNFKKSDVYKKPANYLNKKYDKFSHSKFGEPIVKFFVTVKNMVKAGFEQVKTAKNYIMRKVKSVKSETYENAAVGTVGVSSGACAAVNSLKTKQEAGE